MPILRRLTWGTAALLATWFAGVLVAQTAPNWTQQLPKTSPPPRDNFAFAYDAGHNQIVLWGGITQGSSQGPGTFLTDTWVWDGSNWNQQFPQTSPPKLFNEAMIYDAASSQMVLYGNNQTWLWDGSNWTQPASSYGPTEMNSGIAMAYDAGHSQVVLLGEVEQGSGQMVMQTWVWNGMDWTLLSPMNNPSARYGHAMAYDAAHGHVVLFGGCCYQLPPMAGVNFDDTWVWDGSSWAQESPANSPPARYLHGMAYDTAQRQTVLFGGQSTSVVNYQILDYDDTWVWDGSNWTQESPGTSPPARDTFGMDYDSAAGEVVVYGGNSAQTKGTLSDLWSWSTPATVPPPPTPPAVSGVVSASAFGGFSAVAPGSWVEIYGSNLAPDTRGWAGTDFSGNNAPTSLDKVSVTIGGQSAFVDYISPTQVNAQLPSNIATGGMLPLTVTNAGTTSAALNLTVNETEPGLLAPASFKVGGNQYVVAQHSDGSYVLPTGAIAGVDSSPAKPSEIIVIYGVGFGPVTPSIPAGEIATQSNQLTASLQILFGTAPTELMYFGLAPDLVGLYQFNVVVPPVAESDLVLLTFSLAGLAGTQTLFTAVQQ